MQTNQIVHRYLKNGMEVYLHPTNFAPIVSLQVLVKAGSIDEEDFEGGAAHVLEHMLFKGTKKFPHAGQIASTVEFAGGDINAYTTFDHTNYYLTAPSHFAKQGAELLLDVVQNSLLDEAELKSELEVVIEEIRRSRDNPNAVVSHNLFSLFYKGTRLERPVIGYQPIVEKFDRKTVFDFYKKWYSPNNMIFIAAGDFNANEFLDHLQSLTQDFAPFSVPTRSRASLPIETKVPKIILERGAFQEVRMQLATSAPVLSDHTMPAWDVFASILGEGDSSRLNRTLQDEKQLVTSIDCSCYTPKYPQGLLAIGFFGMGKNTLESLKCIVHEIRRMSEVPPTQEELTRVVNSLKAQRIYSRESMDGITRNAGMCLQTAEKLEFEPLYMSRVEKVTGKQIQKIAQMVLQQLEQGEFTISAAFGNDVLAETSEQDFTQAVLAAAGSMHEHSDQKPDPQIQSLPEIKEWISNYTVNTSSLNPDVKQIVIKLPNEKTLRINYRQSKRLPIASGVLVMKGGLASEPADKNGVSGLTSNMLTRGTLKQNYRKFVEELEDHASSISAFCARDLFGIRFDAMSEHSLRTIQMLLDCFFWPEFAASEWQKLHKETLEILIAQKDNPAVHLSRISQKLLYPNHAYSRSSIGTEESLKNITKEDAQDFWNQLFHAKEFVFSISGDFDLKQIVNLLESEFKVYFENQYKTLDAPRLEITAPAFPKETDSRTAFYEFEREQAHITVAFRSVPITDPRRTTFEIAANILAGQGGRLFLDLRDKKSLAYSVSSSQTPSLHAGAFTTYIGTSAHKAREAIAGLKSHVERLAAEPPTKEEVERAQNSVLGGQSIESQHNSYQASQLAMSDVYGLGFDNFLKFSERVLAVTPEMVQDAMKSFLKDNPPVISIVGPNHTWQPQGEAEFLRWS